MDGDEHESGVCAVKKALDQTYAKAPQGQPLETRQRHLKDLWHVHTGRHDQSVDDAQDEADGSKYPSDQLTILIFSIALTPLRFAVTLNCFGRSTYIFIFTLLLLPP